MASNPLSALKLPLFESVANNAKLVLKQHQYIKNRHCQEEKAKGGQNTGRRFSHRVIKDGGHQ